MENTAESDNKQDLNHLPDDILAGLFREGDEKAFSCLCQRYFPFCLRMAQKYGKSGIEPEDLAQEGMIGFIGAVRRFDPELRVPFGSYARRCIISKMLTAIEGMQTGRRRANLYSVPLDGDEEDFYPSPDQMVIDSEDAKRRNEQIMSLLSKAELNTLRLYLQGCSYEQTAEILGVTAKSVDNALQRVRRKLKSLPGLF